MKRRFMKYLGILTAMACLPFLCGCIEVEEEMNVSSDGAGEVKLTVTIPALGLRWLPGKPTAQWIKPWLPEDVKLTAFKVTNNKKTTFTDPQGKKHEVDALTFSSTFAFKNANDLSKIRIQPDDRNQIAASGGATPGKESGMMMAPRKTRPDIGPFQNLTFLKENETIHFRRVLQVARKSREVDASMMKTPRIRYYAAIIRSGQLDPLDNDQMPRQDFGTQCSFRQWHDVDLEIQIERASGETGSGLGN